MKKFLLVILCIIFNPFTSLFAQQVEQDFEGTFPDTDWILINNSSGNDWSQYTDSTYAYTGGNAAEYSSDSLHNADAWIFTNPIMMKNGQTVNWSFYERVQLNSSTESLKFTVGTSQTVAAQSTTLLDLPSISNINYVQHTGTFTASMPGVYYFAFNCYSPANHKSIYIDDIYINFESITPPDEPDGVSCSTDSSIVIFSNELDSIGDWTGDIDGMIGEWEFESQSYNPYSGPDAPYSGSKFMMFLSSGSSSVGKAISPEIDLTSSGSEEAELSFYLHAYGFNIGTLDVGISTSSSGPFTNIFSWTGYLQTAASDAFLPVGVDISSYIGSNIYLEFKQTSNIGGFGNIALDLIEVTSCQSVNCVETTPADGDYTSVVCNGYNTLKWILDTSTGLTPDSFDIYFGTSTNPSLYSTVSDYYLEVPVNESQDYYYKIVPKYNGISASGCDENMFTTLTNADAGSGGASTIYYFANSYSSSTTSSAAYSYDDPITNSHQMVTTLTSGDFDDGYYEVSLPFSFRFYGVDYSSAFMGTNGYLSFGSGSSDQGTHTKLGSTADPDNMIAVLMMDLDDGTDGAMYYDQIDASTYAFTWYQYIPFENPSEYITVQLIIKDNPDSSENGFFEIRYNQDESSTDISLFLPNAVIGCEDVNGNATSNYATYREDGDGGPIFCSSITVGFSPTEEGVLLPLEIIYFKGKALSHSNLLSWETIAEVNTSHFEVERSLDNKMWNTIGMISASNNKSSSTVYEYQDDNISKTVYYRLKMVDNDGIYSYSDIQQIVRNSSQINPLDITVFPCPFHRELSIELQTNKEESFKIKIYATSGQIVYENTITAYKNSNNLSLDLGKLDSGVYFLEINGNNSNYKKRIVKVK